MLGFTTSPSTLVSRSFICCISNVNSSRFSSCCSSGEQEIRSIVKVVFLYPFLVFFIVFPRVYPLVFLGARCKFRRQFFTHPWLIFPRAYLAMSGYLPLYLRVLDILFYPGVLGLHERRNLHCLDTM